MKDISEVKNEEWHIGEDRARTIRPLAENPTCSNEMIDEAAKALKLSTRYIYKLIKNYRESNGLTTSLIPQKPNGGKGKSRLSNEQEFLIQEVIEDLYLTPQKLKANKIIEEIRKQCFNRNIVMPTGSTIRQRLSNIPIAELRKRREGDKLIEPIIGSFPQVDYPLSVIQMDHTPVDIIIVDPIDRLPIGRPYLTVAIDVYSRCIAGFVLSLEAPSAVSVGLCLTNIAIEKSSLLIMHNIDAIWPIYGKPSILYVDNGAEFHSAALTKGCLQHGIKIEYRPIGKAHYGGIVERVIGTLMKLVHTLPGTTFSNITERGKYPSEKKACLTLIELEQLLITAITKHYHLQLHKGIYETPLKRYEKGIAQMKQNGVKLSSINNSKAFLIDFLPVIHRVLGRDGFVLDHIVYYSNALRPFIINKEKYGKFLIRRDPRDLSRIYVSLPENQGYLEVPYRTLSRPSISLFEHRLAIKRLKEAGKAQVNEAKLFSAVDEIRSIVKSAESKTRTMRRNRTRMQENAKIQSKGKPILKSHKTKIDNDTNEAFSNIEEW